MLILTEIAKALHADIMGSGNKQITEPVRFDVNNTRQDVIMWCSSKNAQQLKELRYGNVICESAEPEHIRSTCTYLIVANARSAFQRMMKTFFEPKSAKGISPTAYIGNNVSIGENVFIGHHVVIEDNAVVGNNSSIDHNTVIKKNTRIGEFVKIGSNTSIGSDGFGFEKNEASVYELIPHIGNVVIEDHVEIGDNVVIDKALMGSTVVGMYSKIDNLVYIAHGVRIGKNCLVIGGAVISGSTIVGDNVWISPNATLINKIQIGNNAVVGIGSVVLTTVPHKTTVAGNPARPLHSKNQND